MASWYPSEYDRHFAVLRERFRDNRYEKSRDWIKRTLVELSRTSPCEPAAGYRRPQDEYDIICAMASLTYSARGHEKIITSFDVIDVYHRTHGEWPVEPQRAAHLVFCTLQYLAKHHYPHQIPVEKVSVPFLRRMNTQYGLRGNMLALFCDEPRLCFADHADALLMMLRLRSPTSGKSA